MGREVKRVPMGFDWPINTIWHGYLISKCADGNNGNMSGCESCRRFAKIKGLEMTSYNCPIIKELEPPTGEGWQMWENVTEGSPISPVFETPEELAHWLADSNASACGHDGATYQQWLNMIKKGWCPSLVVTRQKSVVSGVEACGKENGGSP